MLVDLVRNRMQYLRPLLRRHLRPWPLVERLACCGDGVDAVGGGSSGYVAEERIVVRITRFEGRAVRCRTPVTPDEVLDITPSDAVVSLILPQNKTDIRLSFCCHVHFFASSRVAHDWALEHPRVEIVTVQEAYELGRKLARHLSAVGQATN